MSQEDKLCTLKDAYKKALAKLDDALGLQRDLNDLKATLSTSRNCINNSFACIMPLQAEIKSEKHFMDGVNSYIDLCQVQDTVVLNNTQTAYEETVRQHALSLDLRKEELALQEGELATVRRELAAAETVLKQKLDSIAELQKELDAETLLNEEQTNILAKLMSSTEAQARKSKFVEEHNFLNSESARLDELINAEKVENEAIRKQNSAMSENLAAMKAQNQAKLVDLDALQSKLDESKAVYAREMKINHEIVAEIRLWQQKKDDEIMQLEQQICESRTKYENAKKANDNITNRINAEFGSVEALEEMLLQAEAELRDLNMECSGLSHSIDAAKETIASNDFKIAKQSESNKKFLDEVQLKLQLHEKRNENSKKKSFVQMPSNVSAIPTKITRQNSKVPERAKAERVHRKNAVPPQNSYALRSQPSKMERPNRLEHSQPTMAVRSQPIMAEQPEEEGHIFSHPSPVRHFSKTNKKKRRHSPEVAETPVQAQDKVVIHSADSSVSELWEGTSDMPEIDDEQINRHRHAVQLFKKYFL